MIVALLSALVLMGGSSDGISTGDVAIIERVYRTESQDDQSKEPVMVVSKEYFRYEAAMEDLIGLFQELGPDVLVIRDDPDLSESERSVSLKSLLMPYNDFLAEYETAHYELMVSSHMVDGKSRATAEDLARSETKATVADVLDQFFRGLYSPYGDEDSMGEGE